jgi:hypothetical protein
MAPPVYNGLGQNGSAPMGFRDVSFDYVFDVVLTANQNAPFQQTIDNDSDFAWRATVINFSTGAFSVQFSDSQGFFLSNALIRSANIQGDVASPEPRVPEIVLPAGGSLGIQLRNDTGAGNTIQLVFRGVKRYRVVG